MGYQVVDTWALSLRDGQRWLSMSHTRLAIGRLSPRVGDVLVDDQRQPMLALVEDDSPGGHDTLIPACDAQRYRALGYAGRHPSCADNYNTAVADHYLVVGGMMHDPLNLFMAVPVSGTGELSLQPSITPAGGHVTFEALQSVLMVLSACPQDLVPINGPDCVPKHVDVYIEDGVAPTAPADT